LGFSLQIFEPVLGVDLKLTAEEIESGLVKPNKSLAQLHVKLLKVLGGGAPPAGGGGGGPPIGNSPP